MPDAMIPLSALPEYPRWLALLEANGLASRRSELEELLRPGIALDAAPGPIDGVCSRLGGPPDLPPDHPWPTWRGAPMCFLLQLALDDALCALDDEGRLPASGLLSVFAFLGVPNHAEACAVAWFPTTRGLVRRAAPGPRLTLPTALRLHPRRALTVRPGMNEALDRILPDDDEADAFHDEVWLGLRRGRPDHRLLGWPSAGSWMDDRGGSFFLQIDSDDRVGLEIGDVETLRIHLPGPRVDADALAGATCTCDEG